MTTVTLNTVTKRVEVFSSARDSQARADIAARTVATLAGLASITIPARHDRIRIKRYDADSLRTDAWYREVDADPGHPMAGQDAAGTWFELDEWPVYPEMCGEIGGGDDAPAFRRASQTGRLVKGRPGTTYTVARDMAADPRASIHGGGLTLAKVIIDLTDCTMVLDAAAGVDSYCRMFSFDDDLTNWIVVGGTFRYSYPPYIRGIVTAVPSDVGSNQHIDFTLEQDHVDEHGLPAWSPLDVRVGDIFDADTRRFVLRAFGNTNSATDSEDTSSPTGAGLTLTSLGGNSYRLDFSNAPTDPDTLRNKFTVGDLINLHHRDDGHNIFRWSRLATHGGSVIIRGATVHHCAGDPDQFMGVTDGDVDIDIVPLLPNDLRSCTAGSNRTDNCRGLWRFKGRTWGAGDDALQSYSFSQKIIGVPGDANPLGGTLAADELLLQAQSVDRRVELPEIGDELELTDWATGVPDRNAVYRVTALAETADIAVGGYVVTLDNNVPGSIAVTSDGTGWYASVVEMTPELIADVDLRDCRGAIIVHNRKSKIQAYCEDMLHAMQLGNPYPALLNGALPRDFDVRITGIRAPIEAVAYAGKTTGSIAAAGAIQGGHIHVERAEDMSNYAVRLGGLASDVKVKCDVIENWDTNSSGSTAVFGTNIDCELFGPAIDKLKSADIAIGGTSTTVAFGKVQSATPGFSFGTPGDVSFTATTAVARYSVHGNRVFYDLRVAGTPIYTDATVSGGAQITLGDMPTAADTAGLHYSPAIGILSTVDWQTGDLALVGRISQAGNVIALFRNRDAGTTIAANKTHFPSGTAIDLQISGSYLVD